MFVFGMLDRSNCSIWYTCIVRVRWYFVEALENNAWVMLIVLLLGGFIALLQSSNGHLGFSKIVDKICDTERKTLLMTF